MFAHVCRRSGFDSRSGQARLWLLSLRVGKMRSNQYVAGWPLHKTEGLKRAAVRWSRVAYASVVALDIDIDIGELVHLTINSIQHNKFNRRANSRNSFINFIIIVIIINTIIIMLLYPIHTLSNNQNTKQNLKSRFHRRFVVHPINAMFIHEIAWYGRDVTSGAVILATGKSTSGDLVSVFGWRHRRWSSAATWTRTTVIKYLSEWIGNKYCLITGIHEL